MGVKSIGIAASILISSYIEPQPPNHDFKRPGRASAIWRRKASDKLVLSIDACAGLIVDDKRLALTLR
jgi:hypothetical protein